MRSDAHSIFSFLILVDGALEAPAAPVVPVGLDVEEHVARRAQARVGLAHGDLLGAAAAELVQVRRGDGAAVVDGLADVAQLRVHAPI